MEHKKTRNKVVLLSILWAISCFVVYIISFVVQYGALMGISITTTSDKVFELLILLVVAFYFIPLLFLIRRNAKLANMFKYERMLHFLILMFIAALVVAVFSVVPSLLIL